MNNWLNSLQCLRLVENVAIVRDPRIEGRSKIWMQLL